MVTSVVSPRKSITEVFQRVGGYCSSYGSQSHQKRCGNEIEEDYDEDGTMELVQIGAERTKNVLILMSDTGGGHRASAEAIRDAFRIQFGEEYRVIGLFLFQILGICLILSPFFFKALVSVFLLIVFFCSNFII